jgi:hypothetical protein
MPEWMTSLVQQVSGWPGVLARDHRLGGVEFRLGACEIGHVHDFGIVDVPFTVKVRDILIRTGRAERHRWLPMSGWTTVRTEQYGVENALALLRLSYLRIQMKSRDSLVAGHALRELQESGFDQGILDSGET